MLGIIGFEQFTTRAISTHPSIKFAIEISSIGRAFHDVLVAATGSKTSPYREPTEHHTNLSFHLHIKSFNVLNQLLRLKGICSGIFDYEHKVINKRSNI